jgi:hypothetical protein
MLRRWRRRCVLPAMVRVRGRRSGRCKSQLSYLLSAQLMLVISASNHTDKIPKKYKNSGLRSPTKPGRSKSKGVVFEFGGLNDDDIAEERPNFPQSSKLFIPVHIPAAIKRDNSRRNEVCVRFIITCVRFLKGAC